MDDAAAIGWPALPAIAPCSICRRVSLDGRHRRPVATRSRSSVGCRGGMTNGRGGSRNASMLNDLREATMTLEKLEHDGAPFVADVVVVLVTIGLLAAFGSARGRLVRPGRHA
jgi:hypothetical protein